MKRSILVSVLLLLAFGLCASGVFAAPSYKDRREAKKLAAEAKRLVAKGEYKKAAKKYKRADRKVPKATYKVQLAKALLELDDFVTAGDVLREAAEMQVRPWPEKKAVKQASALLEELKERAPSLTIDIFEPSADGVNVTVDSEGFEPADGAVPFNPGKYKIVATSKGYAEWIKTVKLEEGDQKTVEITMKSLSGDDDDDDDDDDGGGGLSRWPAYVAWGTGAVGLALGVGFGIAAIQSTNDVLNLYNCQNGKCPPSAEADLNVAKTNGHISTVGFVILPVGAIAGTILFLLADDGDADVVEGDEGDEDEDDEDEGMLRIRAQPLIGPGFVGIVGTF